MPFMPIAAVFIRTPQDGKQPNMAEYLRASEMSALLWNTKQRFERALSDDVWGAGFYQT